jgi:Tol biopolymer transport system component
VRQLTSNIDYDFQPSISPDGVHIAYTNGQMIGEGFQIYIMDLDGTNQTRLSFTGSNMNQYPTWSPDGTRIAFVSSPEDEYEINIMNHDGSAQTTVTTSSARIGDIAWSPDGEWLLFAAEQDDDWDTYLINIDGSGQINLTDNSADDMDPEWIP